MEEDCPQNLRCYLYKFHKQLDLTKIQQIYAHLRYRCLALHSISRTVKILKISHTKRNDQEAPLNNITAFQWVYDRKSSSIKDQGVARFVALSVNGEILAGKLTEETLTTDVKQVVSDVVREKGLSPEDCQSVQLISGEGEHVVLATPSHLICLQFRDTQSFNAVSTIPLPPSNGDAQQCLHILSGVAAVLNRNKNTLYFYEIETGNLFCQVDLYRTNIEPDRLIRWQVSRDLQTLMFVENTLSVTVVDLEQYAQDNPVCVETITSTDTTGGDTSHGSCLTCDVGDVVWREKLLTLHGQHSETKSTPWYQVKHNVKVGSYAVTKKRWKVSGFLGKSKVQENKINSFLIGKVFLPPSLQNLSIVDTTLGKSVVSLVFHSDKENFLCVCDTKTSTVTTERLCSQSRVILSRDPNFPHFITTPTHLMGVVMDQTIGQEDFVSKMMVYAGASVADTLCHINKWGRCSIPIRTLEIGLKQRQLDTVVFFLKSKENFFSSSKLATPTSPGVTSPSWSLTSNHHDNLMQLEPALQLLIETVKIHLTDKGSERFSKKLAEILLDFLYELLHDGLNLLDKEKESYGQEEEVKCLNMAIEKLLDLIGEVRGCIDKQLQQNSGLSGMPGTADRVPEAGTPASEWSGMSKEAVIESGVTGNCIPALQTYLCDQGHKADLTCIIRASLNKIVQYLSHQQTKPALLILANLGLNIDATLWEKALMSVNKSTRDFIIKELRSRAPLTQEQDDLVTFCDSLSKHYPCQSHRAAVAGLQQQGGPEMSTLQRSCGIQLADKKYDLSEECGEIDSVLENDVNQSDDSKEKIVNQSGRYSNVLMGWLQWWNPDTQQMVLLDTRIEDKGWREELKCRLDLVVDYLARHNKLDILKDLIDQAAESGNHTIVQEIHSQASKLTAFTFLQVTRYCVQNKLYLDQADFPMLLEQMRYVGGPLVVPHPLASYPVHIQERFHQDFTKYCVHNNLPSLLWQYCLLHRVQSDVLSRVAQASSDHQWLDFFVHMYSVATNPHNTVSICEASVANAALTWSLDGAVIPALIGQGEVLTALATLIYSPHTLQQITPGTDMTAMFGGLSVEALEQALQPYPKLHVALFPTSTIDKPQNDVTIYQLLKDNAPFSPSRLFGWQSMNRTTGEESLRQLPHFSMSELVNRFAYTERIRYTYYLRQGRPSFAFASFLAEQLDTDPTTLSNKSILAACGTALWIGIKNFHNPQISCACVVFTEMLGQNSILIRTYLQVGQEILLYLNSCLTGNIDRRKEQARHNEAEIASWLCGCALHQRKQATFLLVKLEEAISASLDKDDIPSTSFEAGQKWTIAVLFCQVLHIQMTTKFLEECCQADKWLSFLWFAQTHQYPKEQLQSLLYKFKSVHLQQHLHYVIENAETRACDLGQVLTEGQGQAGSKGKDVRSSLYVRIGLKKDADSVDLSSDEEDQLTSVQQADDSDNGVLMVDIDSAPDDVFRVVFVTQSSKCQWRSLLQYSIILRNPLFSELAACIPEACGLPCLCGWLVAMLDVKEHDKFLKNYGKSAGKWNLRHLGSIIDIYLQNNWVSTLANGFHIFQPDSPIIPFFKFSAEFSERRNFSHCKILLEDFKESFHLYCHDITPEERAIIFGDTDWFQQLVFRVLQHHFTHTNSLYDILQLLRLLDSESIVLVFKFEVPDFARLARMLQMVVNVPIPDVNFASLVSTEESEVDGESRRILDVMVERQMFHQAREFAREAGLSHDHITMAEVKDEKSKLELSPLWHSSIVRKRFWKQCANSFLNYKLSVEQATDFFQTEAGLVESYQEKAYLYQLCVQHMEALARTDMLQLIDQTYHTLSIYRIRAKMEQIQGDNSDDFMEDIFEDDSSHLPSDTHDRKKELLNYGKMPREDQVSNELTEEERKALDLLIQELLDSGQVIESCRLATDFHFYSRDLVIILTCIRLALGVVTVGESMDMTMVSLLAESTGHRRLSMATTQNIGRMNRKASMVSLASVASTTWDFLPVGQEKNVITMEALIDHCHHGNQCCKQVLNCYVIATVLDKGYEDVVLAKEFTILKELLQTSLPQRFWLASEFLSSSSLTNSQVAGFLCDSIVYAYKYTYGSEDLPQTDPAHTQGERDLLFNPTEDGGVAGQFVTLCPDPSILGVRLLDVVTGMSEEQHITTALLSVQTELLILSHTCHTTACNMEGISHVLRSARTITVSLANTQNFSLMVRLLTGVGRFTEMTYIFDSLKMNEHFELLLKKGIEKENSLKIALLDYLKRYHPSDIDTYDMVAHNFLMHREIAQMLESRARRGLNKYKEKLLENTTEIKTDLQNIVQDFTEAAESYYKESCLRHAQTCLRHARLVALQIQHLNPVLPVIHLSPGGAEKLIASHPKFLEALIVSETYGKKGSWPNALCHNVLMGGEFRYLQDFKSRIKLTTSLVSETIEKFQVEQNHSTQSLNNLKKFLETHCRDVKLKYKVAQDFGFRDLLSTMEKGDSSSYIQDLVHMAT
ncbi:spatacsin-like isoform X2 [Mizuhopecten yessoensis]|uniref:spatacsin-like isoform X2 n=1 Tax=Mizuhopecten yessoensis TaxID=6573 RepID=UPI000B45CCEE|nr:spatacsin-like isoform X2 [Mizuhopecten yessoensis]